MSQIRVAIFGNGFARSTVLPCLRHVPEMKVVGLASPTLERARQTAAEFGIEHVTQDHRELLQRARPDLVFVVTPPHRHMEQAIDALRSGCHVVCEKPTALNGGESRAMREAAEAAPDRLALIDHELRFDPRRMRMREMVRSGELGEILAASYVVERPSRRNPDLPWSWWSDAEQGGGTLGALGSHAIDGLRAVLDDEVVEVCGHLETWVKQRRDPESDRLRLVTADDHAEAWLRFSRGTVATMRTSLVQPESRHELLVAGSKKGASVLEEGPLRVERSPGKLDPVEVPDELPSAQELGIPANDWARNFLRFARALVEPITRGTPILTAATFVDGDRNERVMDAIHRSHERGGWQPVR